jgi:gliding motility-associated-like protein
MRKRLLLILLNIFLLNAAFGQCPQVYDGTGAVSSKPYWINCTGGAYTLNLSSPSAIGSYTVVWGDGTANTTGASLAANTIITHGYAAVIDTFIIQLITSAPSCTLSGVVVMEKPVNASIQIPVGGVTTACAPATLGFVNSSTDVSQTTSFSWNFGDGSPSVNYSYTNDNQTVTHTYNKGTVNCQTIVTLSAQNYCTFGSPTKAQFNPIQIYDKDQAGITPDAVLKCWPDNSFTFTNTTSRNCFAQGNNGIRYEKWDFGNYWGTGHDSIINWTAWPPSFPKTVAYPALGNYTVILYDSNECGVDTTSISVSIVSKPTAGLISSKDTTCVGTSFTFTNTSSTGYSYQWNYGDNGTYSNTNHNPQTHTYASSGTYTVTVVALISGAPNSCKDTARLVVHVLPSPVSNFTFTPPIGCNSVTNTFTDGSTGAVSWQWNFGNGNTFNGQTPPTQTYTFGTYTVSLQTTSANNCTNTKTHTVTVYAKPIPQFTTSALCAQNTITFTDNSTHSVGDNIITWSWNFGDGSVRSTTENPTHTYTTAATYSVLLSVATANCSDSITVPLTLNPLPIVSFANVPDSGCPTLVVTFTNSTLGASSYNWNFGNGNTSTIASPTETFSNTTTSSITFTTSLVATSAAGCKDSTKKTIKVFGKPIAAFGSNALASCAPFNVTFTNSSTASINYLWNFGDGTATSTSVTPTHFYQNTTGFLQNYTVTLHVTNAGGCQDSTKQTVQAYPQAQFNFSSLPDSGCTLLHVNFPASAGAVSYQWNFGDGSPISTGSSPAHTFTNTTTATKTFTVQLIATNAFNCVDTAKQPIYVFPVPNSAFTQSVDSGCANLLVNFTNQSTNATSFNWLFGDGGNSTATNTNHTYSPVISAKDSFQVSLISYNIHNCTDTVKKKVYVFPKVIAHFTTDTIGCSPFKSSFINSTQNANTYSWNFGDGSPASTIANPVHIYTNTTTAAITYTAQLISTSSFSCTDVFTKKITVYPKPTASFSLNTNSGCSVFTPVITNHSVGDTGVVWSFGDGGSSILASPVHSFTNTALTKDSFNLQLTVTNAFACKDTAKKYVSVLPKVHASFTCDTISCSPLKVTFINSTQGASGYVWHFGDAATTSTAANPVHIYTNTTISVATFTAELIGNNSFNCADTALQKITVYPKPTASFSLSANSGCSAFTPTITNSSVGDTGVVWNFGDGGTSILANPVHTFTNTTATKDSFNVQLVVTNIFACKDTAKQYVYAFPKVVANFTCDTIGCSPLKISFANTSQNANIFAWDFGDGSLITSTTNPTHIYTNTTTAAITYTVELYAENSTYGCTNVFTKKITVLPKPMASFSLNTNSGCSIFNPVITNNSTGYTSVAWIFGDGGSSIAVNPVHSFTNTALTKDSFNVQLIITNASACKDTTQKYLYVLPKVHTSFTSDTVGCSPLKVSFINSTQGASGYIWNFGDATTTSTLNDPIHVYTNTLGVVKTYTAQLIGNNSFNCADTTIEKITVYPKPTASFSLSADSGCSPVTPIFTDNSIGATTVNWNFGDGTTSTFSSPNHTFVNTSLTDQDSFNVQLIVTNAPYNCKDTTKKYLYVFPKVLTSFYADTPICAPVNVKFHNTTQSTAITTYTWNFGDGNPLNNAFEPQHTYNDTTGNVLLYVASLSATNSFGCTSTFSHTYDIYPKPTALFNLTPSGPQIFPAATIGLTNQTANASSFTNNWSFGDGTTSTQVSPAHHTYNTWGTYSVTLTVSSTYCRDSITKITVISPPPPIASFIGGGKGCTPFLVTFQSTSQFGSSYLWNFGDGNTQSGTDTIVTHQYNNNNTDSIIKIRTVKLVVTGPGGKDSMTIVNDVTVYPNPIANFIIQPLLVTVGIDPIVCTNHSGGATSYIWNFGDNTPDVTDYSPSHIYQQQGQFAVTLIAISQYGCRDTLTYPSLVTARTETNIQIPNAFTPSPAGPSADGVFDPASPDNDIFHPNISGLQTYELDIFNRWGELLFVTKDTKVGWDGYYKGKLCEQGTYIWKIRGTSFDGLNIEKAGDLTLLR